MVLTEGLWCNCSTALRTDCIRGRFFLRDLVQSRPRKNRHFGQENASVYKETLMNFIWRDANGMVTCLCRPLNRQSKVPVGVRLSVDLWNINGKNFDASLKIMIGFWLYEIYFETLHFMPNGAHQRFLPAPHRFRTLAKNLKTIQRKKSELRSHPYP